MTATRSDTDSYATTLHILNLMKALGYANDANGACQGISMMGIQALATGEVDHFHQRLQFIATLTATRIKDDLDSRPINPAILDVIAFFDAIQLYQSPEKHASYFGKNIAQPHTPLISPLTASKKLEEHGGLKKPYSTPGIYDAKELEAYFSEWERLAQELGHPLSFSLGAPSHAIAIHYDLKEGWLVLNSIPSPIITPLTQTQMTLSAWIKQAFAESSTFTAFETSLFFSADEAQNARIIERIGEKIKPFPINEEIAKRCNDMGSTLAHIAAQNEHTGIIQTLLQLKVNANPPDKTGITPADNAASNGCVDVIEALLQADATSGRSTLDGEKLVFIAAEEGHAPVIRALHQAHIPLDHPIKGATPLFIAAQNGHATVVDLLMAHQVGSPMAFTSTASKLIEFAQDVSLAVLKKMHLFINAQLQVGVNESAITLTPWQIACIMDRKEVIECLRRHGAAPAPHLKNKNGVSTTSYTLFSSGTDDKSFLDLCYGSPAALDDLRPEPSLGSGCSLS